MMGRNICFIFCFLIFAIHGEPLSPKTVLRSQVANFLIPFGKGLTAVMTTNELLRQPVRSSDIASDDRLKFYEKFPYRVPSDILNYI